MRGDDTDTILASLAMGLMILSGCVEQARLSELIQEAMSA
jgi:hypothetical protein